VPLGEAYNANYRVHLVHGEGGGGAMHTMHALISAASTAASRRSTRLPVKKPLIGNSAQRIKACGLLLGANVAVGSKPEKLNESICFPLFTQQRTSPRYFGMSVSCRYCCKSLFGVANENS
jgi:hypothetical protein